MASMTPDFEAPATEEELEALAGRLGERNFEVVIVRNAAEAKAEVFKRLPEGSSVHSGKSKTLEDAGIFEELMNSDRYDFLRRRTSKMDRATQLDEIRRIQSSPDVMLGSVHAVTEAGHLVITSASGSQLCPIASGRGLLSLVISIQNIVPSPDDPTG